MNQRLNKKQYTLTKKGWFIIGIVGIILISIILYNILNRKEEVVFETYKVESTISENLSNALKNNEISIDEYVLYTAYSIYEPDKLENKYKSQVVSPPDLLQLVSMYETEISDDTLSYINEKLSLKDIKLGPINNTESSFISSNIIPVSNNVAKEGDMEKRLDKHILSPNKKVVVWYTTNDTEDKITDAQAETIAKNVETYIEKYSNEYNVNYKWERSYVNGMNDEKYKTFLEIIDSKNADALFDAMPIYVSSSTVNGNENSIVLAYYASFLPGATHKDDNNNMSNYLSGIPVGPYINVNSKYVGDTKSLNSTIAHELFHHFQKYICGEGEYKYCEKNKNGDPLFVIETTANWAATKVTENSKSSIQDTLGYFTSVSTKIDQISPYQAVNFLVNYENKVENGKQKIINALLKKYHNGDTLKYLYDESNNTMPEIMKDLSKNNLINNYENENYKGAGNANYNFIASEELKEGSDSINAISMKYLSLTKAQKYKISNTSKNSNSYITVFIADETKKVTVETFSQSFENINSFEDLKVIYSEKFDGDKIFDFSDVDGKYVILSITNGSLNDKLNYSITETSEKSNTKLNPVTESTNSDENESNRPEQVYKIYVDGKEHKIDNFELNGRAYVDINQFCSTTSICNVSYTDKNYNKVKIISTLKTNNTNYQYVLINEKQKEEFDSTLTVKNINYDLSQLSVDASSCPKGKDSNGYEIPKCDENSFYVPIRFVTQALGYNVNWSTENNDRIDINSGLQEKLVKDNNIRTVLSKNKVAIGNTVTNIIELDDTVTLEKNEQYYAYSIDSNNKRIYNSGFALLSGNKSYFKIKNDLDTEKNSKTTYSRLETGSKNNSGVISIVTTITIPDEANNSKAGIYPIIKEVKVNIK